MLKEGFLVKRVSALRPRARVAVEAAERAVAGRAGEAGECSCWPTRPAARADPVWLLWFRDGSGLDLLKKQLYWG